MIKNFETVIGIEIHLELNTKTKMFSPVLNLFNQEPNTLVSPIDLGYPGTLPTVNKQAVIKAIKLAKALNMKINHELHFDRKNYYYTDLPKGFQITQQFRPIGKNGAIEITIGNEKKLIEIERIHLEEDTAKQLHENGTTYINYNRAGVPLIEIVSRPVMSTAEEAQKYVDGIRQLAMFLNISDAIMAEGSLRADINISTKLRGAQEFGTKVEIKNLNSLNNIKKAIEFEQALQIKKIIQNQVIEQETKRFDEAKNETVSMRKKTDAIDYCYFPEPNIPIIKLSQEFIDEVKIGELPNQMRQRYHQQGIPQEFIEQLINNLEYSHFIDQIDFDSKLEVVKIFFSEIVPLEKKVNTSIKNINLDPKHISKLLKMQQEGFISGKQIKQIIPLIIDLNEPLEDFIKAKGFILISDENIILDWINQVKSQNPNLLNDYQQKPEATTKFIAGEIMKMSKGQANPVLVINLIKREMEK